MSEFFKGFLSREIVSLTVMLAVLLARLLFRRAPKRLTVALWAVVCFRLLVPRIHRRARVSGTEGGRAGGKRSGRPAGIRRTCHSAPEISLSLYCESQ